MIAVAAAMANVILFMIFSPYLLFPAPDGGRLSPVRGLPGFLQMPPQNSARCRSCAQQKRARPPPGCPVVTILLLYICQQGRIALLPEGMDIQDIYG
jgi:hypothetical protein